MRHVAHDGHGTVVLLTAQRHHAGLHAGDELVEALEVLGHRVGVRAEDPVRSLEQVGAGAVDAVLLRSGHGVAGHVVARHGQELRRGVEHVGLGGDGVGDDALIAPVGKQAEVVVHAGHRRGDHHELAALAHEGGQRRVVGSHGARGPAALLGQLAGARVHVDAHDEGVREGLGDGGGKRGADEPQAHDGDGVEGGSAGSVGVGGLRGRGCVGHGVSHPRSGSGAQGGEMPRRDALL